MKKSKIEALRRAGWKLGGVREFLQLSEEDVALIELKLSFADIIRETRVRRDLTQTELAKMIGSSQSRVAKIEAGGVSVSLDLMFRTAFSLGISVTDLGKRMITPKRTKPASRKAI